MTDPEVLAADGRVIGTRALATRRKLLDTTAHLLDKHGVLDLRVVDITRELNISPATFYQYFGDVDAAILALAEEATEDEKPLVEFLRPAWTREDGLERAREFIDAYMAYWDSHSAVLRVRNLKAEEGVKAFREVRSEANLLIIAALKEMVSDGVRSGRLDESLDPFTTAAALIAMIERLLAFQNEMAKRGSSRREIRETLARLCFGALAG